MNSNSQRFFNGAIRTVILSMFLGLSSTIYGQNLVPNPSFEDTIHCPIPNSQLYYSMGWLNPNGYSPDYYHSCANSTNPNFGTPNNWYGFQVPRTGVAYAGIYIPVNAGNNLREYVQTQLTSPLIAGNEYLVRFYVSLGDSSIFSINSIGAYLSTTAISSPTLDVFNVTPQVVNNASTNPLIDDTIWYEISDSITAVGGEEFITIGNFQIDSNADTTTVEGGGSPSYGAYYYIDDVNVSITTTSIDESASFMSFEVFPNPVNDKLRIRINKSGNYHVQMMDMMGNLVSEKIPINNEHLINVNSYPNGVYFIQVFNESKLVKTSKLIINH